MLCDVVDNELDLYVGQKFLYLFDFGDCWTFDVVFREIQETPYKGHPKIISSKGEAPPQYSPW